MTNILIDINLTADNTGADLACTQEDLDAEEAGVVGGFNTIMSELLDDKPLIAKEAEVLGEFIAGEAETTVELLADANIELENQELIPDIEVAADSIIDENHNIITTPAVENIGEQPSLLLTGDEGQATAIQLEADSSKLAPVSQVTGLQELSNVQIKVAAAHSPQDNIADMTDAPDGEILLPAEENVANLELTPEAVEGRQARSDLMEVVTQKDSDKQDAAIAKLTSQIKDQQQGALLDKNTSNNSEFSDREHAAPEESVLCADNNVDQADKIIKLSANIKNIDNNIINIDNSSSVTSFIDKADSLSNANTSGSTINQLSFNNNIMVKANNINNPILDIASPVHDKMWSNDLGSKIIWMVQSDVGTASIKLHPPELGFINVDLKMHHEKAEVIFNSVHDYTKEVIEQSIPRLKEIFSEHGMLDVNINSFSHSHSQHTKHHDTAYLINNSNLNNDMLATGAANAGRSLSASGIIDYYA